MWGALSDGRMSMAFTTAAGTRQRSHSWVRAPRDSWPYFTVKIRYSWLHSCHFLYLSAAWDPSYIASGRPPQKTRFPIIPLLLCLPIRCLETGSSIVACIFISAGNSLPNRCLAMNYSGFQASCHIMFGAMWDGRMTIFILNAARICLFKQCLMLKDDLFKNNTLIKHIQLNLFHKIIDAD
jgi:hypothetical protein